MADHYVHAMRVRQSLVRGDLEAARAAAKRLEDLPSMSRQLPGWDGFLDRIRIASQRIALAPTLTDAAKGTAGLAAVCAECHTAVGDGPDHLVAAMQERTKAEPGSHMATHQLAADAMWVGVMAPDDALFQRSAELLAHAPDYQGQGPDADDIAHIDAWVHEISSYAPVADRREDRIELYGAVLASCAECHAHFGIEIP